MGNYSYLSTIEPESSNLIKALQLVQAREGYVSDEAIVAVAEYFSLAPVEVEGVLSFYAQFKRTKPGKYEIAVCSSRTILWRRRLPPLQHRILEQATRTVSAEVFENQRFWSSCSA